MTPGGIFSCEGSTLGTPYLRASASVKLMRTEEPELQEDLPEGSFVLLLSGERFLELLWRDVTLLDKQLPQICRRRHGYTPPYKSHFRLG